MNRDKVNAAKTGLLLALLEIAPSKLSNDEIEIISLLYSDCLFQDHLNSGNSVFNMDTFK